MESNNRFIYLLNIPTVRQQILQYLSINDVFRLKCVSRRMKLLIDETYLPFELTIIDRSTIYPKRHDDKMFDIGLQVLLSQTCSLLDLNLCDCQWLTENQLIDILKSNPSLKYLNINYHGLSPNALHSIIVHGMNVKTLNLVGCEFDSHSLDGIESAEIKFEELRLKVDGANHKYADRLLQKCEHLRALTLEIGYCPDDRRVAIVLETLRNCKNLKMLRFGDKFDDDANEMVCGFSYLAACKNIEILRLQYYNITDAALKSVSNLRWLKQLVLKECLSVTEDGIGSLTVCENLQILSMNWVNDTVLRKLTHRNLRKLYLRVTEITAADMDGLINRCPRLKEIFLLGCQANKRECFRVLNVVIHVIGETKSGYIFDEYCESHKQIMYLK